QCLIKFSDTLEKNWQFDTAENLVDLSDATSPLIHLSSSECTSESPPVVANAKHQNKYLQELIAIEDQDQFPRVSKSTCLLSLEPTEGFPSVHWSSVSSFDKFGNQDLTTS